MVAAARSAFVPFSRVLQAGSLSACCALPTRYLALTAKPLKTPQKQGLLPGQGRQRRSAQGPPRALEADVVSTFLSSFQILQTMQA